MSDRPTYAESLTWLYSLQSSGMKFGLGRMRRAAKRRGSPQDELPIVHVAGTNGKGSTCAMIERGLRAAGYKTGWFSSPHLHRYAERFRVGGRPLSDDEVARRVAEFRATDLGLTFFEYSVLLAFEAFRDHQCDVAIIEVGLGGRLDATNIIARSELSVVTRIALDHTSILGNSEAKIAREKGGIFRPGGRAVIGTYGPGQKTLLRMAASKDIEAMCIGRDFDGEPAARGRARIRVGRTRYESRLGLGGAHQVQNAASAAAALHAIRKSGFRVPRAAVETALQKTRWAGRLEVRRKGGIEYIFDCAHNPDGCRALAGFLEGRKKRRTVLLFGALADKEHEAMLSPFDGRVDERVYAIPKMRRAPDARELKAVRPGRSARSVSAGLKKAQALAGDGGRVVVAGSIFLVSAARAELLGLRTDPPIAL